MPDHLSPTLDLRVNDDAKIVLPLPGSLAEFCLQPLFGTILD